VPGGGGGGDGRSGGLGRGTVETGGTRLGTSEASVGRVVSYDIGRQYMLLLSLRSSRSSLTLTVSDRRAGGGGESDEPAMSEATSGRMLIVVL